MNFCYSPNPYFLPTQDFSCKPQTLSAKVILLAKLLEHEPVIYLKNRNFPIFSYLHNLEAFSEILLLSLFTFNPSADKFHFRFPEGQVIFLPLYL